MIVETVKADAWKRNDMYTKCKNILLCLCAIAVFVVLGGAIPAKAAETEDVEGILQQISEDTELRQTPNENADVLERLEAGTALIIYGEPEDSWSKAEYMGMEGYVKSDTLKGYNMGQEEELAREFSMVDKEIMRTVDEYELEEKEKHSSRVRIAIIGALVLAIFVLGIASALKKEKETP